jgi:hypothetical protein
MYQGGIIMKKTLWLLLGVVVILGLVICKKAEYGAIDVKSTPTGATIYLDGEDTGDKTDAILDELEPADYIVKLTLQGYEDYLDTVTVEAGDTVEIDATLKQIPPAYGSLQVNSTPTGATIWLDSDSMGVTNALLDSVLVGDYTVKLILDGYEDYETSVTIVEGETDTVDATLTEKTGSIQVNSNPDGAAILLDGSSTGFVTDHLFTEVSLGNHTIELTLDGYADWDTTVTVTYGQTETIDVTLEEEQKEEVEIKYDEATPAEFGFKMDAGQRLAAMFTPPSYPFELTQACFVPMGWADDPDHWNEACYFVFFGPGEEPGTELGRQEVAGTEQFNFNWFDMSDLDITITSGSFYFGVENKVNDNPGLALDIGNPEHHVSWMYTVFIGEIDPKWAAFDNISISGWPEEMRLGDSCDVILRLKGMVPGSAEVELTPTVRHHTSYSNSPLVLPVDRKYEILDWRNTR